MPVNEWSPEWTLSITAIIAVSVVSAVILTRGLISAGRGPAPSMLVVSVSLLSLTALIGGLIFDSDSALALAGAGVGAIAGALSSVFTNNPARPCKDDDDDPPTENEDSDGQSEAD